MQSPNVGTNTVVLYMTHMYDEVIAGEYARLKRQCEPNYDVRLLYDASNWRTRRARKRTDAVGFRPARILRQLGRHMPKDKAKTLWPGSSDLVAIAYALTEPAYEFYWLVEYDVRFTGAWSYLFNAFADNRADLLATAMCCYRDNPDWHWWPALRTAGIELSEQERIRSFMPLYRISNRALQTLRSAYRQGWQGHYECTVATILNQQGLSIEDIGGNGPFVAPHNVNRFYTSTPRGADLPPGTFVWRPVMNVPGDKPNTLWHPVKPPRKPRRLWRGWP